MNRPTNAAEPFSNTINRSLRTHARFAVATSVLLVAVAALAHDARVVLGVLAAVIVVAVSHPWISRRRADRRSESQPASEGTEAGSADAEPGSGAEPLSIETPADAADWRVDPAGGEGMLSADAGGAPAGEPLAAGKGSSSRARRRRNRIRAAEPVAASWVQVAPGRFVRVEDSDQAAPPGVGDASPDPADTAETGPTDEPESGPSDDSQPDLE